MFSKLINLNLEPPVFSETVVVFSGKVFCVILVLIPFVSNGVKVG